MARRPAPVYRTQSAGAASGAGTSTASPRLDLPAADRTARRPSRLPSRARPRDREQTQQDILDAVARVLAREGFGGIGVNAIAKEAGVDKVLIYRYFGGLPELLAFYGGSGQFWPSVEELLGPDARSDALTLSGQLTHMLERFVDALKARPLTIEILAWETVERNELTAVLETVREEWGKDLETRLRGQHPGVAFDVPALMIVFTAAVQYLLVRARTIRVYGGIDLHTPEGWARLRAAMGAAMAAALAPEVATIAPEVAAIAPEAAAPATVAAAPAPAKTSPPRPPRRAIRQR